MAISHTLFLDLLMTHTARTTAFATATEAHLTHLGSSSGAITAAHRVFSLSDSFPRPVGGQPANLLPVNTQGSWIARPKGSAILAGIRQQVLYSPYPRAPPASHAALNVS